MSPSLRSSLNSVDTKHFFNWSPYVTFDQEAEQYMTMPTTSTFTQFVFKLILQAPSLPRNVKSLILHQTPTWGTEPGNENNAKATWLGYASLQRLGAMSPRGHNPGFQANVCLCSHACYLVELPTPPGAARGVRIIFDPVFSNRGSPFRWLGSPRYTGVVPASLRSAPSSF